MAFTGFDQASLSARHALARLWSRLIARLGPAEHLMVQRLAGAVFLIRVVSALLRSIRSLLIYSCAFVTHHHH